MQILINTLPEPISKVRLLIGPEGGLSAVEEIGMTEQYKFEETLLAHVYFVPTAALTAITAFTSPFWRIQARRKNDQTWHRNGSNFIH